MGRHNHRPIFMGVIIGTAVLQLIVIIVHSWAMLQYDIVQNWFNTAGPTGAYFDVRYGPPKWFMEVMYPVIYLFHILWLGYGLFTLFRKTPTTLGYLYYDPNYMPIAMYVAHIVSLALRLTWAALLPNCGPICTALLTGSALASTTALIISLKALYINGAALYRMGLSRDVILVRAFVHNGLALYTIYEYLSVYVNLTGVMVAEGYTQRNATSTILATGALLFLVYIIIDFFIFDKYLRYVITPYLVYSLSHIAVLERHWYSGVVSALTFIFVGLALFALAFKIFIIIARGRIDPEPIPTDTTMSMDAFGPAPTPAFAPMPGEPFNDATGMTTRMSPRTWIPDPNNMQLSYL